jgi:sigma54-dependent transcription regulator
MRKSPHRQLIAYRLAAWLLGGTVHQFEGRDRAGRWYNGLCILSHDALVAHKVSFRYDARVYSDTALVEPSVNEQGSMDEKENNE